MNNNKTNIETFMEIDLNDLLEEYGYKEDVLEKKKSWLHKRLFVLLQYLLAFSDYEN